MQKLRNLPFLSFLNADIVSGASPICSFPASIRRRTDLNRTHLYKIDNMVLNRKRGNRDVTRLFS